MKFVSPEYESQLRDLSRLLCPLNEVVQLSILNIPRDEEYDEPLNRWCDMGTYMERE